MNMNSALYRTRTFSALSIALFIIGTANAHHKSEPARDNGHVQSHGQALESQPTCTTGRSAAVFNLGVQQSARKCSGQASSDSMTPAPIRLAKPLSGTPYRSEETVRYSF